MKIAVASQGKMVSDHFGHCQNVNIFEIEDKKIVTSRSIDNPPQQHGYIFIILQDQGAEVVITGSMGQRAQQKCQSLGLEVITGATGSAADVVESYLRGELKSSQILCGGHEHQHGHGHDSQCRC
ncbi:MAG: NifB/NifX family molybdenum-iron cluster-binding protein [Bacillota bacterium]